MEVHLLVWEQVDSLELRVENFLDDDCPTFHNDVDRGVWPGGRRMKGMVCRGASPGSDAYFQVDSI